MPAYVQGTAPAVYPGDTVILSNAALAGLKTKAVVMATTAGSEVIDITINNESAQVMTLQYAHADAEANYQAFYVGATAATIAANKAATFQVGAGFYRLLAAADPGATLITLSR